MSWVLQNRLSNVEVENQEHEAHDDGEEVINHVLPVDAHLLIFNIRLRVLDMFEINQYTKYHACKKSKCK